MARSVQNPLVTCAAALALYACGESGQSPAPEPQPEPGGGAAEPEPGPAVSTSEASLKNRAYIVSLESDELTVIDLDRLEIIGSVSTEGVENHMAELNADFTKVFIDSSHSDETVVVDAREFEVVDRIVTGKHPSHLSLEPNSGLLAIMLEDEDSVAFLDSDNHQIVKKLPGMITPHFMRFTPDGKWGYVANAGANQLTRVRMDALEIDGEIVLDGYQAGSRAPGAEGGFMDAQIDKTGTLYAAHKATGRVIVYDTGSNQKLSELQVGARPWVVFAEHPFADVSLRHLVPNFGDRTVSLIDGAIGRRRVLKTLAGDEEAYGVNFSSLTPDLAFVMNRVRSDVAVVDTNGGEILERIEVGGNTETASTTADGKYIVAAVSSANSVVVLDARTRSIVKTFYDVGRYPWSVTIPGGQNYCH